MEEHMEPDMDNMGGASDHDEDNYREDIKNIAQAISLLADKVDSMDHMYDALNEQVDKLGKLVNDDLIGGLTKLYDDNDREIGIRELQDKYGEELSPYESALKSFNPDMDVWDSLFKSLKELKGQEGYNDEVGDNHVRSIIDGLGSRFGSAQEALSKLKPVASVKVEKIEGEPEKVEEEEKPEISAKQKRMMAMAEKLGSRVK